MAGNSIGYSAEQRRLLPTILVPAFMSLLSVSIVNVTLPAIDDSLDAGTSGLQWVVSGYALVFGVLLVAAGRAGDVWGRGRLFVIGLACFALGSLLSGLAPSILVLNLARVVMGIGSGILNPQVTGIIQQFFQGELRGRAFGAFGGIVGVSVAIGPILGGGLIAVFGEEIGWRASFLVNVPIAIGAIIAARSTLPASAWSPVPASDPSATTGGIPVVTERTAHRGRRTDFDPVGMVLLALGTLLVMLPFMEAGLGWWVWSLLVLGVAIVVAWVQWERRYRARGRVPMVDLELFRTRSFANGALLIGLYFVGNTSIWLLVAQYMQRGLGHDALSAGLVGLPAALLSAMAAPIAGRFVVRVGRVLVLWGLVIVAIGLLLSAGVSLLHGSAGISEWWLLLTLGLTGLGQGLVVSPNQTLSLAEVPLRYAGSAGGVLQTGQRIGTAIGIAVITSVAFGMAAAHGWDLAIAIGFGVIIAVIVLTIAVALVDLAATRRARGEGRA
ncbi:MFS transporter [Gulosibacter faecalis]|jgi:MFS family permease|uniref:MFS transporter n=1 Tax=Gulosibacter faecalis TaxID=272240 RepID=A0ABW5UXZ6_9MICO|nr:MFS transporter [Gulosibacter faecalis]